MSELMNLATEPYKDLIDYAGVWAIGLIGLWWAIKVLDDLVSRK